MALPRPVAGLLSLAYALFTVANLLLIDEDLGRRMSLTYLVSAVGLGLVALLLPHPPRASLAHPLLAAYGAVIAINTLSHMVARAEPWQTAHVMLLIVAFGAFMVDRRWLVAAVGLTIVAWLPVRLSVGELSDRIVFEAGGMFTALLLAFIVHLGHRQALVELLRARDAAESAAVQDCLTGLLNRRGLSLLGAQVLETARRQGDAVHATFLDVDGLKQVNDRAGHDAGDQVLVLVADALRAVTRATDVVARWGGDEFCVIGSGPGLPPGEMEERVSARAAASCPLPLEVWVPRVSAGGAVLAPWDDGDLPDLLGRADRQMYLRRAARPLGQARLMPPVTPPTPADERDQ